MKYLFLLIFIFSAEVKASKDEPKQNFIAPLVFGGIAVATIFNSGKTPRNTRNFWLYGAITSGLYMEDSMGKCLLGTSLGMVAINQYYIENPDKPESEAGRANLLGSALGIMSPLVFDSCMSESTEDTDGLSIMPTHGEMGIQLSWKFSF